MITADILKRFKKDLHLTILDCLHAGWVDDEKAVKEITELFTQAIQEAYEEGRKSKKASQQKYQERHKKQGLCVICHEKRTPRSSLHCEKHRLMVNKWENARYHRKRADQRVLVKKLMK